MAREVRERLSSVLRLRREVGVVLDCRWLRRVGRRELEGIDVRFESGYPSLVVDDETAVASDKGG